MDVSKHLAYIFVIVKAQCCCELGGRKSDKSNRIKCFIPAESEDDDDLRRFNDFECLDLAPPSSDRKNLKQKTELHNNDQNCKL